MIFFREEAEQRRLQELENKRRQQEELEREQEMLRKKMIEERLVSGFLIPTILKFSMLFCVMGAF